jgi:hypothetical protein
MSEPIVFISRNRIREGMRERFSKHYLSSVAPVVADKPGTLAQLAYWNQETDEVAIVRIFPSADALDRQLLGADRRSKVAYEFIEPISIEILGKANPSTLENMKSIAGSGIAIRAGLGYLGGFIR